jgi:uncharacterized protein (TIGR02118 family)
MLKLSFCLHRLPGLSREEFQRYWRESHAPLVRRHAAALGIERYVQVHAAHDELSELLRASRSAPEPYDGVAELWWRDRATFEAALATPLHSSPAPSCWRTSGASSTCRARRSGSARSPVIEAGAGG